MKKFRTMALVLAAVIILPYNARSAEVSGQTAVTDETAAESSTTVPDETGSQTTSEEQIPADTVSAGETSTTSSTGESTPDISAAQGQSLFNEPLKLPNANPTYNLELKSGSLNVTYPNHESSAHDSKYIPLIINGTLVDSEVLLVHDRTLAPLRVLTEALGGSVDWNDAEHSITITKGNDIIKMTIGSNQVYINGVESTIDVPPDIYNDLTYLPLRFVAETLGAQVTYNTGEYDPVSMAYQSYKLVQGVSANAVIDQYDPSWPVYSKFQAQSTITALSQKLFDQFTQQNNANNPDKDYTSKYNFILYNINNTRIVGSVSRYYVVESFCLFLFDKYTGTIYTAGSNSTSNWVRRYAEGDPQNMNLFTDTYFFK